MARILFLSVVYEPDTVSTAVIAAQRVRQLRELGHDVAVLTSVPHYNVPAEVAADPSYGGRPWRPFIRAIEAGLPVVRCYVPPKGTGLAARALGLTALHAGMFYAALRHFRDRDVVVIISPPLTFALIGLLLRRMSGAKVIFNVQELWPDVPRDLGVIRSRAALGMLSAVERWIYRSSDMVVAIGPRFAETIRARGGRADRVVVVPNSVDTTWITPTAKDNPLAREWGVADKPVVLYAGNIGLTQDFDTLLAAASALERAGVAFVVVGGGAGRPALEERLQRDPHSNVVLKDFVPAARVAELYGLSDVVVVLLKRGHDRTTTPSKVFSAMAARRPLVVSASEDTDLAGTVRESLAGIVVPLEDPDAVVGAISRLLAGVRDWDPDHALAAARSHAPEAVGRAYHDLIERLDGSGGASDQRGRPARVLFAQFANPGAYPPVLNAAATIASELGARVRFVGVTTAGTEGMAIPAELGSGHLLIDLPPPGWRQKAIYLRWLASTVAIGVKWRADLVYVSDFYAAPAGVLLHPMRVGVVYHEHDYPPPELQDSFWIRLLLRCRRRMGRIATLCVAPGDDRARRLARDIGSKPQVHSVANFPSVAEIGSLADRARSVYPTLHYHGSVGDARLPLSVLEALALLPVEVTLQVVGYETIGSTGYFDRVRRRAMQLGVANRVSILPAMPRPQLFEVCRSASVGLMLLAPDSNDFNMRTMAFASNKIFDYLACGLPVVMSDAPGLADLVRGAGVGVVCKDLSPAAIAAAVSSLLDAPHAAANMGRRGRDLIEKEWNFDVEFRPVIDVLRRTLGQRRRGRPGPRPTIGASARRPRHG